MCVCAWYTDMDWWTIQDVFPTLSRKTCWLKMNDASKLRMGHKFSNPVLEICRTSGETCFMICWVVVLTGTCLILSYLIADHRFTVLSDAYQSSWRKLVDWIAAQPLTWTLTQQNVMRQTFDPLFKVEDLVFRIRTCKSVKTGRAERQKLEINADRQEINLENLRSNFSTVTTWKCD